MADVDVVIGLGRCVIEAMASHRAAYVFGVMGSDGWATPDSYPALDDGPTPVPSRRTAPS